MIKFKELRLKVKDKLYLSVSLSRFVRKHDLVRKLKANIEDFDDIKKPIEVDSFMPLFRWTHSNEGSLFWSKYEALYKKEKEDEGDI